MSSNPLVYYTKNEINRAPEGMSSEEDALLEFINQKISSGNSLDDILGFLFANIQILIPCDRIGVSFLEEGGTRMVLSYVISNYEPLLLSRGYSAELSGSSLQQIFNSETPRIINDLIAYGETHQGSESTMLLIKESIQSSMTCPLRVDDRPVGLLFFSSKKKSAYAERELKIQLAISERLSQAVEKAYRIDQLSNTINAYMDMLGFISHEFKSPLDSIISIGNTLVGGYFGTVDDKIKGYVDRMIKKAEYCKDVTNQYLTLSQFENAQVSLKKKEIIFKSDIVKGSIEIINPLVAANAMTLSMEIPDDMPPLMADPSLLKIVVNNLLSNAVKYGNRSGAIRITAEINNSRLRCSVWNEGPGFSVEDKKLLFRKFSRIQKSELLMRKGTGIGLYSSWKIIQLHGGKIWADSEEGKWAEFVFEIPINTNTQGKAPS